MVLTQTDFQGVGRKSIEEHTTTSKDDEEAKLNAVKDQVKIISRSLFFLWGGRGIWQFFLPLTVSCHC